MTSAKPFDPASATIAIVTYNRSHLLRGLLESIITMEPKPGHVVVIDNALPFLSTASTLSSRTAPTPSSP